MGCVLKALPPRPASVLKCEGGKWPPEVSVMELEMRGRKAGRLVKGLGNEGMLRLLGLLLASDVLIPPSASDKCPPPILPMFPLRRLMPGAKPLGLLLRCSGRLERTPMGLGWCFDRSGVLVVFLGLEEGSGMDMAVVLGGRAALFIPGLFLARCGADDEEDDEDECFDDLEDELLLLRFEDLPPLAELVMVLVVSDPRTASEYGLFSLLSSKFDALYEGMDNAGEGSEDGVDEFDGACG